MIGSSPTGSSPLGSYALEGYIAGQDFAFATETSAPSLVMLVNIEYAIAAETKVPSLTATATLTGFIEFAAETTPPALSAELLFAGVVDVAATTSVPALSVTMTYERLAVIAAETPPPALMMTLLSESLLALTAETASPSLALTFSNGLALNIALETAPPALALSIIQDLAYAISGGTAVPSLMITLSGPAVAIPSGETTAWCVNMVTGDHSRYTNYPDASGTSAIPAYALTGVSDFGDTHEKYIPDLYVHCRLPDSGLSIDVITDEVVERDGYEIEPLDSIQGLTRRRRKLAKGIRGQNWQFRFNNINSGGFTLKTAEPAIVKSSRRI